MENINLTQTIEQPFSVSFAHKHEKITITLKNNSDLFVLASHYKNLLDQLNIEYIVSYKNYNND
jgi:hypothetical protein